MRRAGATFSYSAINFFFLVQEMIVPGADYWNLGLGRAPGDVMSDTEGVDTFKSLGKNMAWLLNKIKL
jgi:multimeric flavodoxin WrbA